MRLVARILFSISIFSIFIYAFTGKTIWVPFDAPSLRGLLLFYIHISGIAAGIWDWSTK